MEEILNENPLQKSMEMEVVDERSEVYEAKFENQNEEDMMFQ
jgi:hypothetical protein